MVRSFSRFDPAPEGNRQNRDLYVFQKWISSVAPLLVAGTYNEETWRTARPWLDFTAVRRCHYKYLQGSLGKVKCGEHIISDAMIAKAVTYEKAINRVFDHSDADVVRDLITKLFEPCLRPITTRTAMMNAVNDELLARGMSSVTQGSQGWRNALIELGLDGIKTQFQRVKMQLRKDCTDEFVHVIELNYEPHDEEFPLEKVRGTIARYLAHQKRNIAEHEMAVDRAIRKTSLFLKPRVEDIAFREILGSDCLAPRFGVDYDTLIQERYEYDPHATTPYAEVRDYISSKVGEVYQAYVFKAALRRICKKNHSLLPMRRRQQIPWDNILYMHCKRGKSKHTIPFLNIVLEQMGYTPYDKSHAVWEFVYAKGVQPKIDVLHMIRKSCSVTRRTSSRQDILRHINAHYDLELVEDSPEWVYAMRHFKDGPLSLTPN